MSVRHTWKWINVSHAYRRDAGCVIQSQGRRQIGKRWGLLQRSLISSSVDAPCWFLLSKKYFPARRTEKKSAQWDATLALFMRIWFYWQRVLNLHGRRAGIRMQPRILMRRIIHSHAAVQCGECAVVLIVSRSLLIDWYMQPCAAQRLSLSKFLAKLRQGNENFPLPSTYSKNLDTSFQIIFIHILNSTWMRFLSWFRYSNFWLNSFLLRKQRAWTF